MGGSSVWPQCVDIKIPLFILYTAIKKYGISQTLEEIYIFNQQGWIQLIKSVSEDIYNI